MHIGQIETGGIDVQPHVTATLLQARDAAHALDDAGKHQRTSTEKAGETWKRQVSMNVLHASMWERPKAWRAHTACAMRAAVFFHPDCAPWR
ncbi:hypothetical protein GCM10027066_05960 [Dyella jejuensis]